ncbi:Os10g0128400, partial [Oryza sativa Japonica Group]
FSSTKLPPALHPTGGRAFLPPAPSGTPPFPWWLRLPTAAAGVVACPSNSAGGYASLLPAPAPLPALQPVRASPPPALGLHPARAFPTASALRCSREEASDAGIKSTRQRDDGKQHCLLDAVC